MLCPATSPFLFSISGDKDSNASTSGDLMALAVLCEQIECFVVGKRAGVPSTQK
jgi:hypothetical protein